MITVESPLHRKLCALESVMNKLCDAWQEIDVRYFWGLKNDFQIRKPNQKEVICEKYRMEQNGYVQIAERMDWFFMIFFLILLTIPVVYLYIYMQKINKSIG